MLRFSDYRPSAFQVDHVHLQFDLQSDHCIVQSKIDFTRVNDQDASLILDGENLELLEIRLDGKVLTDKDYKFNPESLQILKRLPEKFTLQIATKIYPQKNTALEGLYESQGIFCTQCEPQAFRKITYFLDRPDVMTTYEVVIEADEEKYPVLLSNGNCISKKSLGNGRHLAQWKDPSKKSSYLFALVAGDLEKIEDTFQTKSGRSIKLEFYAAKGKETQCAFAMESLKHAMAWDEKTFDLEYDLDQYLVVSIDDFNSGAMENKGLNVFNSKLVLANQDTATDEEFEHIESVIAHEYFHNYSGNLVTLRDWFNISLKEGLTVFRDQEFSSDRVGRGLKRISDVNVLKSRQFPEDAGPTAHPVLPKQGTATDNFFSLTIYEKGAEIIRMIQTLLGQKKFREILSLYFKKFEGQALTILDFVKHFEVESGYDFKNFTNWYHLAGTPHVHVRTDWNEKVGEAVLTFEQKNDKAPLCPVTIPIVMSAFVDGNQISIPETFKNSDGQSIYLLKRDQQRLVIRNLKKLPQFSLFQNFSAPVILKREESLEELLADFEVEKIELNLFEVSERIYSFFISSFYGGKSDLQHLSQFTNALVRKINSKELSPGMKAKLLEVISPEIWAQNQKSVEFDQLKIAYQNFESAFFNSQKEYFLKSLDFLEAIPPVYSPENAGKRALQMGLLKWVSAAREKAAFTKLVQLCNEALNMTYVLKSLSLLTQYFSDEPEVAELHQKFYEKWKGNQLVLTKWMQIQSAASDPGSLARIHSLMKHPAFEKKNPNSIYSVLRTFGDNVLVFHDQKHAKENYQFFLESMTEIDQANPQVAARLGSAFNFNGLLPGKQKTWMKDALKSAKTKKLSPNTSEKIASALGQLE